MAIVSPKHGHLRISLSRFKFRPQLHHLVSHHAASCLQRCKPGGSENRAAIQPLLRQPHFQRGIALLESDCITLPARGSHLRTETPKQRANRRVGE